MNGHEIQARKSFLSYSCSEIGFQQFQLGKTFSQLWHLKPESFRIYEVASLQLLKIGPVPVLPNATVALYAWPCINGLRFDSLTVRCNLSKIALGP